MTDNSELLFQLEMVSGHNERYALCQKAAAAIRTLQDQVKDEHNRGWNEAITMASSECLISEIRHPDDGSVGARTCFEIQRAILNRIKAMGDGND